MLYDPAQNMFHDVTDNYCRCFRCRTFYKRKLRKYIMILKLIGVTIFIYQLFYYILQQVPFEEGLY
jgi:hypothetical protein